MQNQQNMNNKKQILSFPEETISEILKYLPPKDLGRFKTVSKPWLSLIESSFFANNTHLMQIKKENQYMFIFQAETGKHSLVYDFHTKDFEVYKRIFYEGENLVELLTTCNGLILFYNADDVHFLDNPITMDTIVVPNSPIVFPQESNWAQVFYGVGFDQLHEDYKVVQISYFNNDDRGNEVKIFSTKNASWRHIQTFPYEIISLDPGVFVHDHLHWKVYRDLRVYGIASLDCQTESYDLITIIRKMSSRCSLIAPVSIIFTLLFLFRR